MGLAESITRARAARAEWNPNARRMMRRRRWLSPSRRASVNPSRIAARRECQLVGARSHAVIATVWLRISDGVIQPRGLSRSSVEFVSDPVKVRLVVQG